VTPSWNETDEEGQQESDQDHDGSDTSEEVDWDDVVDEDSDFELVESLEAMAFADEYRGMEADHVVYEHADYSTSLGSQRHGSISPNKRSREM